MSTCYSISLQIKRLHYAIEQYDVDECSGRKKDHWFSNVLKLLKCEFKEPTLVKDL